MEKRKTTIIFVIGVILIVSTFLICNKHTVYQTQLDDVKLVNNNTSKSGMFAIMINDGNGEYKQSDDSNFPTEGYSYNEEKSGCIDSKGLAVENVLTYTDKKFSIKTNQAVYCYVYFDKVPQTLQTLQSQTNSGLSTDLVGGMYRYQGTDTLKGNQVKNYICLEKVGSAGCSSAKWIGYDDKMYRIIGITSEGKIKVIKQIIYNKNGTQTFKWNTKYSSSDCSGNNCDWPNTDMYKTLNENDGFISTLDSSIQNKIEPQQWLYGDISIDYINSNIPTETVYKIETGQENTKYYDKSGSYVTDQKWKEMEEPASIGLMYIHDYAYALSGTGSTSSCRLDYENCKTSWIHMSNNGAGTSGNESIEWTMSRIGPFGISDSNFVSWVLSPYGNIYNLNLTATLAVRPVFYLESDVELGGEGSTENPFYIMT